MPEIPLADHLLSMIKNLKLQRENSFRYTLIKQVKEPQQLKPTRQLLTKSMFLRNSILDLLSNIHLVTSSSFEIKRKIEDKEGRWAVFILKIKNHKRKWLPRHRRFAFQWEKSIPLFYINRNSAINSRTKISNPFLKIKSHRSQIHHPSHNQKPTRLTTWDTPNSGELLLEMGFIPCSESR